MFKPFVLTMLIHAISITNFSCSANRSKTTIKHEKSPNEPLNSAAPAPDSETNASEKNTPEYYETLDYIIEYEKSIDLIADACSLYRVAYGKLPERLNDLLNGFLISWPILPETGQPLGIIGKMPDPDNPAHFGKVYYKRNDDITGSLYILNLNPTSYEQGKYSWVVREIRIFHQLGPEIDGIQKMSEEERYWWTFNRLLDDTLRTRFINASTNNDGKAPSDFTSMMTSNGFEKFAILKEGLDNLREGIKAHNVVFEIGIINNGQYYYVDRNHLESTENGWVPIRIRMCLESGSIFDDSRQKALYWLKPPEVGPPCPEGSESTDVLFSSADFGNYTFPDSVIITKDQIPKN